MPSCEKSLNRETKNRKMLGFRRALKELKAGAQGRRRDPRRTNPPGADRELGAGQERQRGEANSHGDGGRRSHAVWGAEMSDRGWWVAGAGCVQVG